MLIKSADDKARRLGLLQDADGFGVAPV